MMKTSTLLAAMLFAFATAAHAQTEAPTKPTTGAGAATTVKTNPAATESNGQADKGLATAERNITKPKPKTGKASKEKGTAEKAQHAATPEHPARPERVGR